MDKQEFVLVSVLLLRRVEVSEILAELDAQLRAELARHVARLQAQFTRLTSVHTGDMRMMLDDLNYLD